MTNIGDKVDNTPGASGELTAAEYNDHKNCLQEPVTSSGQTLSGLDTPDQLSRAMFIYGTSAQSMQDAAPSANIIELTPLTGSSGLITPDAYTQMDGLTVEFDKPVVNTSSTVTVNFGQSAITLLGAKSLKKPDGTNPLIGQVFGRVKIQFDVSNDYWIVLKAGDTNVPAGYIETELDESGTDLIIRNPTMEIGGYLNKQSNITIDLTALVASTWYACVLNETTGTITAENISSVFNTGGGGNWDISGNQLDIYTSIWDSTRKYCRAYDATDYYRVFGVFKTNSTPNGIDSYLKGNLLFYIPNLPKSKFFVYRNANQTTSGATIIDFDTVTFDINSIFDTSNFYVNLKFPEKLFLSYQAENLTTSYIGIRQLTISEVSAGAVAYNAAYYSPSSVAVQASASETIEAVAGKRYRCTANVNNLIILGAERWNFHGT